MENLEPKASELYAEQQILADQQPVMVGSKINKYPLWDENKVYACYLQPFTAANIN